MAGTQTAQAPAASPNRRRLLLIIVLIVLAGWYLLSKVADRSSSTSVGSATGQTVLTPRGGMKLKRFWSYELDRWQRCAEVDGPLVCEPYFVCNYTSQTCQSGYRSQTLPVYLFVLLADDRKTVISHQFCWRNNSCLSFDTGEVWDRYESSYTVSADIPENCVLSSCDIGSWIDKNFFRQSEMTQSLLGFPY